MKRQNKNLIPAGKGRPRFRISPGSGTTRSKVPSMKRSGIAKNIFANLKRIRKGL